MTTETTTESTTLERRTYTIDETAVLMGMSRNKTFEAAHRGDIPCIRIGRRMLVPRAALHRMLDGAPA